MLTTPAQHLFRLVVFFAVIISTPSSATAQEDFVGHVVEPGHSAVWYDSENPGTGWVVEILRDDRASVYWYGFDDQGRPSWQVGGGTISRGAANAYLQVPTLYAGSGARFGDAFDPDDVVLEPSLLSANFWFDDCEAGSITHFLSDVNARREPLDRLTRTMGAGCAPLNGEPGFPVRPYAGQSGTWYDPARSGEGITLQWMARDEAVLYWFTYDLDGNALWLVGVGSQQGGNLAFPVMHAARRAPDGEIALTEWGSLSLELECNTGVMNWSSLVEGYGDGQRELVRLNALASPGCPTVKPAFTDLYTLQAQEIPGKDFISIQDVADDGSLLGYAFPEQEGDYEGLVVWSPVSETWEPLGGPLPLTSGPMLISADGRRAWADPNPTPSAGVPSPPGQTPTEWIIGEDWSTLPGFEPTPHVLVGASQGRTALTGYRIEDDRDLAWVWTTETGVRRLGGLSVSSLGTRAVAASNAGDVVIGLELVAITTPVPGQGHQTGDYVLRWKGDETELLTDDQGFALSRAVACSADCNIVFGEDTAGVDRDSPRRRQPWFWRDDGRFGVIEGLESTGERSWLVHTVDAVSGDGSLILGHTETVGPVDPPPPPNAWLWTQATGLVDLRQVLEAEGLVDPELWWLPSGGIAVSRDGRILVLRAYGQELILNLVPKTP